MNRWEPIEVETIYYPNVGKSYLIDGKSYYVCGYDQGNPLVQLSRGNPPIYRVTEKKEKNDLQKKS